MGFNSGFKGLIKHRYSFIFQLSLFYLPIFLLRIFTSSLTLANSTLARTSYKRLVQSPSPGPPSPVSETLPSKYDLLFSPESGGSTFLWNSSTSTKLHFFTSQGILTITFVGNSQIFILSGDIGKHLKHTAYSMHHML